MATLSDAMERMCLGVDDEEVQVILAGDEEEDGLAWTDDAELALLPLE